VAWQQQFNEQASDRSWDDPDAMAQMGLSQKPGVFMVRMLANKSELVRDSFEALWALIRPELLEREACAPRIWRT
jgi:urease accessory protein